jgi:D-3-phosphoglycerate dehydrogenase
VDVRAAAARGIGVSCVGEYCTQEVADHTLALLLALNRRLLDYYRQVQTQKSWDWNRVEGVHRLAGRKLGLIGFGRIGRAVCRRARAFGLEVLAFDPQIDATAALEIEARLVEFDELLESAHIVSLHCNLHDGNRGLLNRDAFARMRNAPLLINVARGGLIVEADLVRALDEGQVSGAALDVLSQESPDLAHHPLAGRPDVLLTPHVAFYSDAALEDLRRISAQNIAAFLQGRPNDVFRLVSAAEVAPST